MSVAIYHSLINKLPFEIVKMINEYADPETTYLVTKMQYWINLKKKPKYMENIFTPFNYGIVYDTRIFYKPETIQLLLKVMHIVKLFFKPTKTFTKKHVSTKSEHHIFIENIINVIDENVYVTPELTIMAFLLNNFEYKINIRDDGNVMFKAIIDMDFADEFQRNVSNYNKHYDPVFNTMVCFKIRAIKYFEEVFGLKFKPTHESRSYLQMDALPL